MFGVASVLTAEGGPRAALHVMPTRPPGTGTATPDWMVQQVVAAGDVIPTAEGQFRVLGIVPPDPAATAAPGSEGHGAVTLSARPDGPRSAPGTVFLPREGFLVLGETDPRRNQQLRAEALDPGRAALRWLPAMFAAGGAAPDEIRHAEVRPGDKLLIGTHRLAVEAVTGRWVVLRAE
jgi:hypothetical protein